MSRKHNTKHNRSRSNYPARLASRGLGKSPKMTHYADLYQGKREAPAR